jgi:hypothetical protein
MKRAVVVCFLVGCANDPVYIPAPMSLEAGMDDGAGGIVAEAESQLVLPIRTESMEDQMERAARAEVLGVDVPYVKLGDIEVSIEWTIKNLEDQEGIAIIELNGANEYFAFDPDLIMIGDGEDLIPTPPLEGNIPLHLEPNATLNGVFREDQIREASIDLDQITRANVNPFAALLTINKQTQEIIGYLPYDPAMPEAGPMVDPNFTPIPREAFAQMIRMDLVFIPSHHMVLEYAVRVRDVRGEMMAEELLDAPPDELTVFEPADYSIGGAAAP